MKGGSSDNCAKMKLQVSPRALEWFKEEVGLPEGNGIRFKTKIYGSSPVTQGYALAIEPNTPNEVGAKFEAESGPYFFIEKSDLWFFDGHDLMVDYDEELDEPKYIYLKDGQAIN